MQTLKDYLWLFWGHLGYLILAEQNSSGLACADNGGLLVVFTSTKPSPIPLHVAVSDVAVSQVAVFLAASINITNYNPDWVCGLFLEDLELHNSSTGLCSTCEDPGSTPSQKHDKMSNKVSIPFTQRTCSVTHVTHEGHGQVHFCCYP